MTFEQLGLNPKVLQAINDLGFSTPTPIQEKAIPHLLGTQSDFVGLAQTGTGKTAAFGLPLVSIADVSMKRPQGLVICPTRELCLQISSDIEKYAAHSGHKIIAVYGGSDIRRQMKTIEKGVHIVVATPGRLVDLIKRKAVKLGEVETVVLDEADEMLNMGFKEDIDFILDKTPEWKNVWLFSATMPKEVAAIAKNYMQEPLEVSIGHKNQTNENIEHIYFTVKERDRYRALKRVIDFNPNIYGLVFCRTRRETAVVADKLGKDGYNAEPLHGDLSQAQRDRVMDRFRDRSLQILVATDVAARGIDVNDITHVINYNLPDDVENYTHRSGRTARAGKHGESLVLINTREEYKIRQIEKVIKADFHHGFIPTAEQICEVQLMKLIDRTVGTDVNEQEIDPFIPLIMEQFDGFTKEDVIKHFVSAEFNRFIDYYKRSGDLNAKSEESKTPKNQQRRRDRRRDENKVRFFVNMGRKDRLNAGGLVRHICDSTALKSNSIGRIDIMGTFSFFEADSEFEGMLIKELNGSVYEGREVRVEVTNTKKKQGSKRGGRSHGGGGQGRGGSLKKFNKSKKRKR